MWHISTDDGLKTESVYDLAFDSEGKAWLGTYGGLMSYEGIEVISHQAHDQATHTATNLLFDKNGDIYFTNFENVIFRHDVEEDSSHYLKGNPLIGFPGFGNFYINKENRIWFLGEPYIYRGFVENDSVILEETLVNYHLRSTIMVDEHGVPWLIAITVDPITGVAAETVALNLETLEEFEIPDIPRQYNPIHIADKIVWFSAGDNRNVFKLDLETQQTQTLLNQEIELVRSTGIWFFDDKIFIGSTNGLFVAGQEGRLLEEFSHPLFAGKTVSGVGKDREGNFWVTTLNDGVWILPNLKIIDVMNSNSTSYMPIVRTLAYREKEWLLCTDEHKVVHLDEHLQLKRTIPTKQLEHISCMIFDQDSNLLVGGYHGLEAFEMGPKALGAYELIDQIPLGVREIAKGPENTFLISNWNNSFLYYPSGDRAQYDGLKAFIRYSWFEAVLDVIGDKNVRNVFYDTIYQNIWQSMPGGPLVYHNGATEPMTLLDEKGKVQECMVNVFAWGRNGTIWMGTPGSGLFEVRDRQILRRFKKEQGLKSNVILDIKRYKDELWLATFGGLQMLNLNDNSFQSFNEYQGIKELPYNTLSVNEDYVTAAHHKICLLFNKKEVAKPQVAPPIFLRKVRVNGRDTVIQDRYELSYEQENIQVLFASLHYSSSKSYDFEYRILEQTDRWQMVPGEASRVDLNGLRPGNYTFQVRAVNSAGVRSEEYREVVFVIGPAYWRTLPFQFSVILFFGMGISLVAFVRIRTLKKQSQLSENNARIESEKQQLENKFRQAQLSALKAQLNPHFIFNALNSIQEFILLNDRVQANRFLGKFADLMRLTLENSNKKTISLKDEIKLLDIYLQLEGLRFEDQFNFEISGAHQELGGVEIPAMLIQPYVENALKHGLLHKKTDRRVSIRFELQKEVLMVCIEDNGIGRKNSEKINAMRKKGHKSFAMGANEQRLELLNTGKQHSIAVQIIDLYSATEEPEGTKVILSIPIH